MSKPTTTQPHNHTTTQPHNHTTTQPHNHTTTQPHNHTTTQPHNPPLPLPLHLPVRILIKTQTHLLPIPTDPNPTTQDNEHHARKKEMLLRIIQHHWKYKYEPSITSKFYLYGAEEGGGSRKRCFFMLDHFGDVVFNEYEGGDGDEVPILCYEWTGEEFKYTPHFLTFKKTQKVLAALPFTSSPTSPSRRPLLTVRENILQRLSKAQTIPAAELDYMQRHHEDIEWLRGRVKERSWERFLGEMEGRWMEVHVKKNKKGEKKGKKEGGVGGMIGVGLIYQVR